jgi:hypothetical protein
VSQPSQVFTPRDPANGYVVIDDSAAPTFPTLNAGTHIGYDTTIPGAVGQSQNVFKNGNIPDFVQSGKTFTTSAATALIISYKLPS